AFLADGGVVLSVVKPFSSGSRRARAFTPSYGAFWGWLSGRLPAACRRWQPCHVAGFGGGDAGENLAGLNRPGGRADAALDHEFFANPQRMFLHGYASVRRGRVRTLMGKSG